ncbi:Nuclear receptor domain-containing protein [Aphelenchoides besseyi]|nr:Nuclear receptor domain-containing protein [Aphelenchoides besseyi]
MNQCLVCGKKAWRCHYNVFVCNSCASFYRRSIILRKQYICIRKHSNSNAIFCKSCRFQRCVELGMCVESVLIRKPLAVIDSLQNLSILQRAKRARDGIYINKIRLLSRLCQLKGLKLEMGVEKPDAKRLEVCRIAEYNGLINYMNECKLPDMISTSDMRCVSRRCFYRWLFFAEMFSTLRHGGNHCNLIYLTDCGYVQLDINECFDFIQKQNLNHTHVLTNCYFDMFNRGMEIAVRVHDARLDSTESALLLHFLILSGARDQFPLNNTLNEHINKLMKETFRYYEENYREARVRFGNLLLLFYHFNVKHNI